MVERYEDALWLEWSGLPKALNAARANGWLVFKTLVEIDCRSGRRPGMIEISAAELGERCGLDPDKLEKVIEALRKKKMLKYFLPEHPEEEGLIELRFPVETPIAPEEVARRAPDPRLRNPLQYRYAHPLEEVEPDVEKIQAVVDLYMNRLSQRMNTFVLEQIEIIAERFEMADIERTIDRAANHEVRSIGWVLKELIREKQKKKKKL